MDAQGSGHQVDLCGQGIAPPLEPRESPLPGKFLQQLDRVLPLLPGEAEVPQDLPHREWAAGLPAEKFEQLGGVDGHPVSFLGPGR